MHQRSGQVYHTVLGGRPTTALRLVEIRALLMDGMTKRCECEFRAAQLDSPLSCSRHGRSLKNMLQIGNNLSKTVASPVVYYSGLVVILATEWLVIHLAPPRS